MTWQAIFQKIIDDSRTATVDLVGGDDRIGPNGKYTLNGGGPGAPFGADGLTVAFGGQIHVYVRKGSDPRNYAYIGSGDMSNDRPGYQDQNTVLGHELGHELHLMKHGGVIPKEDPPRLKPMEISNDAALKLENKVRKLEDKNAATRTGH